MSISLEIASLRLILFPVSGCSRLVALNLDNNTLIEECKKIVFVLIFRLAIFLYKLSTDFLKLLSNFIDLISKLIAT